MTADAFVQQLHDRATRGMPLSVAEQQSLSEWYAIQDQAEHTLLRELPAPLAALRRQVDESAEQLRVAAERIQALTANNEALRREVDVLQARLAEQISAMRA